MDQDNQSVINLNYEEVSPPAQAVEQDKPELNYQ